LGLSPAASAGLQVLREKFAHHRVEVGAVAEAVAGAFHDEESGIDAGFFEGRLARRGLK